MYIFAILVIALQAYIIAYMAWDRDYGCFTRAAFNLMYLILKLMGYTFIVGDIDSFKAHNSKHGHGKVNRMVYRSIRAFFSKGRLGDLVFRLYSGDEFIIATRTKNVASMMSRIRVAFLTEGFSITVRLITGDIDASMLRILSDKKGGL